ncbi:DUF58 domain-containing protein [Psychroflexus sediminis]|uniref:Uncharacterized conserved protein, DUF58 family, contains vWF domain n=1 Tax=Psychroflexus sediminis TaxID=470826 RepID=A0A1G7XHQ2_9FLAO|nr:DUF58 domain-containing protein [Psychroflexus sediminis]SDG83627.1 Uncharacterized conserved protein, DUF58 family, contains vWF domain [Psychroflexus sediminis]
MRQFISSLYFGRLVYTILYSLSGLFLLSFWFESLFIISTGLLIIFTGILSGEVFRLFSGEKFSADRILPDKFSNSDSNAVELHLENKYNFPIHLELIDEIPEQFQKRDFLKTLYLTKNSKRDYNYTLTPVKRGEYKFGYLNCYVSTTSKLVKRRYRFENEGMVKVYPSFIQMRDLDFLSIDHKMSQYGMKKIRRIGHTMEFEQIKNYVTGDDIRTINWKATAKHNSLMINQYQDEKSQPIYNLIDVGRVMKMPFEGLSLLDYSINASLAFSNIALKKKDKVGMLTFANTIENFVPAQSKKTHLNTLLETLYGIQTNFLITDFNRLYAHSKRKITQRSLLMMYTNFEHMTSLKRQLPYLRAVAKSHLLVVIFFENTELDELANKSTTKLSEIYEKTIAQEFVYNKQLMVKELEKNGIQAVLTKPKDLSVKTINKYLEIKAKGLL